MIVRNLKEIFQVSRCFHDFFSRNFILNTLVFLFLFIAACSSALQKFDQFRIPLSSYADTLYHSAIKKIHLVWPLNLTSFLFQLFF